MSNNTSNDPDHDAVFSLLPWYVNQTLDGQERAAVSHHLKTCGDCQRELQFLETLNNTVKTDAQESYRLHADVEKDLASVMDRLGSNEHQTNGASTGASFLQQKLGELLSFTKTLTVPQWGVTAVAGLLVAVLGFQVFYSQPDDDYSVLSSPAMNDTAMRLSVDVMPSLDQEQAYAIIEAAVTKLGQPGDIQTNASGGFIVVFKDSVGVNELSKLVDELQSKHQIRRVELLP